MGATAGGEGPVLNEGAALVDRDGRPVVDLDRGAAPRRREAEGGVAAGRRIPDDVVRPAVHEVGESPGQRVDIPLLGLIGGRGQRGRRDHDREDVVARVFGAPVVQGVVVRGRQLDLVGVDDDDVVRGAVGEADSRPSAEVAVDDRVTGRETVARQEDVVVRRGVDHLVVRRVGRVGRVRTGPLHARLGVSAAARRVATDGHVDRLGEELERRRCAVGDRLPVVERVAGQGDLVGCRVDRGRRRECLQQRGLECGRGGVRPDEPDPQRVDLRRVGHHVAGRGDVRVEEHAPDVEDRGRVHEQRIARSE